MKEEFQPASTASHGVNGLSGALRVRVSSIRKYLMNTVQSVLEPTD